MMDILMATSAEAEDMFEDIVLAEERFQSEGYNEGICAGRQQGYNDGKNMGQKHGARIGSELGFYLGFVCTWQNMLTKEGSLKPRKLQALESLQEMVRDFPLSDPENSNLQDQMQAIRAKFKQVCSLLNVKPDYGGGGAVTELSF